MEWCTAPHRGPLPPAEKVYKAYGKDYLVQDGDVMHFKHR